MVEVGCVVEEAWVVLVGELVVVAGGSVIVGGAWELVGAAVVATGVDVPDVVDGEADVVAVGAVVGAPEEGAAAWPVVPPPRPSHPSQPPTALTPTSPASQARNRRRPGSGDVTPATVGDEPASGKPSSATIASKGPPRHVGYHPASCLR